MNAKTETRTISMEYDLPYPPAKVWRALTEPKLLAAWLMDNDMRPLAGHSFTFKAEPTPWWDGIVRCEVLEIEQHKRLRYSWRSGPASSPLDTVVTWTLTPTPSADGCGRMPPSKPPFEPERCSRIAFNLSLTLKITSNAI